jgi:hypothetical protein
VKPKPECLICGVPLTIDLSLWQFKETKDEMTRMNITKKVWKKGRQRMERLMKYVKK